MPIGLHEKLPTIPIPLLRPDPDVTLDLQSAVDACFNLVHYERLLDYTQALPLLSRHGASGTVFVETEVVGSRTPSWMHRYFFICAKRGETFFADEYARRTGEEAIRAKLQRAKGGTSDLGARYDLKRVLKYEAPVEERSAIVDALFREAGGDERALCDELYLDWEGARALDRARLERGAHTVHQEILSRLDAAGARAEIEGSRRALERGLGHPVASFAYPFGRRWDYHAAAVEAARGAGLESATNTHAGTNSASTPRYELKRVMIDEDARLHLIATEACGGFDLLRRFGLDLSE